MLKNLHFSYIVQNRSGVEMFKHILVMNTKEHKCIIVTSSHVPKLGYITVSIAKYYNTRICHALMWNIELQHFNYIACFIYILRLKQYHLSF